MVDDNKIPIYEPLTPTDELKCLMLETNDAGRDVLRKIMALDEESSDAWLEGLIEYCKDLPESERPGKYYQEQVKHIREMLVMMN